MSNLNVKKGVSFCDDPRQAVEEVAEAIRQADAAVVIVFVSAKYDLQALGEALKGAFDCPVVGCTTAGEITSETGYSAGGLIGMSLSSSGLVAHPRLIDSLSRFDLEAGKRLACDLRAELKLHGKFDPAGMFGLLLVDGLSMLEESVTATLFESLEGIPLVGGAAGDDLQFRETRIYWEGRFITDAAVVTLFETTLPFRQIHIQHFESTDIRLAITECDSASRIVFEINGAPAASEYARVIGLELEGLTSQAFAAHPVMLKVDGKYHVRSIQRVNPDGSLKFYCAVDNGQILTVGRGGSLVDNLATNLAGIRRELPTLKTIIGCDCILRRIELQQKGQLAAAEEVLEEGGFFGFSTYGEQFNGVHVNQTLTGIALGE